MDYKDILSGLRTNFPGFEAIEVSQSHPDQLFIKAAGADFKQVCLVLHKMLPSPVMMLFATDERRQRGSFTVNAVFVSFKKAQWVIVSIDLAGDRPKFESLAKEIHSASFFERQIREMYGIEPEGNPDLRRLNLHDEVWPEKSYPLRKDFKPLEGGGSGSYQFSRVEGSGIFEVPVGPVHAGIIGPGHFRFSCAGEPVINLELRLGFTHRGVEKLFEGKTCEDALKLSECVSGDSCFAHSLAFTNALEKISGVAVPDEDLFLRGVLLELERMYNHVNGIGGIALDAGFSFPAAFAAIIKEAILQLNFDLSGSRYLKSVNRPGGVAKYIDRQKKKAMLKSLSQIGSDFEELTKMLYSSVSFMDRVDTAGVLKKKTAVDLGIVGLVGRASGIPTDLRKYFPGIYRENGFKMTTASSGDVLARLTVRADEFKESLRLIRVFCAKPGDETGRSSNCISKAGSALGYVEGWRGPVLYWVKIDDSGLIERCNIVDASFHNWQGLSYAVLGNIIPDFPLCNKSFDLSYSANDL